MGKIQEIKKKLEQSVSGKKAVFLFTGDKGTSLLIKTISELDIDTIFIDTGYLFNEIDSYRKKIVDKTEIIKNKDAAADNSDMEACCKQRKAMVLQQYLMDIQAECIIVPFLDEERTSGIEDSYLKGIDNIEVIRPLSACTEKDVWTSINDNKIPFSTIYNKGYKVIDCKCCTTRIGRKVPGETRDGGDLDGETMDKLRSLGYM